MVPDRGGESLGYHTPSRRGVGRRLTCPHPAGYDYAEARAEAERMLAEQLAGVAAVYPDVRVTREVIHSLDTARTLVDRSGRAQLIVVGSRGRGGVARLVHGSVSQALINRVACPVAVVRFHAHG